MAYAASFTNVYATLDSRLEASREVERIFPPGSTIGVEHTGISMGSHIPKGYIQQPIMTGTLFNLDRYLLAHEKVELLFQWLEAADGLALIDAGRGNHFLAAPRSYPIEHQFYRKLYDGKLGFESVASYRRFPSIFGYDLDDGAAEISFYAFDHPRVTLFVKNHVGKELIQATNEWGDEIAADDNWTDRPVTEGLNSFKADRLEVTEQAFHAALQMRPDYTLVHLLLAGLYERHGLAARSDESWQAALATTSFALLRERMFVNDLEGLYLTSQKLFGLGARQTARRCLQFAESHGGHLFLSKIGVAYLRYQMPEEAISVFERLVTEEPSVAAYYADLCRAHLANNDRDRARTIFGFYAELEPDVTKREVLHQLVEPDLSRKRLP